MNRYLSRGIKATAALASGLLSMVLFAPTAFATGTQTAGGGSAATPSSGTAAPVVHYVVTGGMAGWAIALIAIGAALLTAILCATAFSVRPRPLLVA
ncbi:MAG TPA: hypothetical protein VGG38_18175 [Acidimicrobiales bacterium]|jgi:TRAP-type C4-dicarboxylate transport system permease small subunit